MAGGGYKKIDVAKYGFKPGQSGNPKGRPKLLPEHHGVKKLTAEDLKRLISKHLNMTLMELKEKARSRSATTLELSICSSISRAIRMGDFNQIEMLLVRVIGRVRDVEEMASNYNGELDKIPASELVAYLRSRQETPAVLDVEKT